VENSVECEEAVKYLGTNRWARKRKQPGIERKQASACEATATQKGNSQVWRGSSRCGRESSEVKERK
jgi:hypothetical protein